MGFIIVTLLGTVDCGLAFTTQKIIWKNAFGEFLGGTPRHGEIPYSEFTKVTFEAKPGYDISMGNGKNFNVSGSYLTNETLVEILNAIKKLFVSANHN